MESEISWETADDTLPSSGVRSDEGALIDAQRWCGLPIPGGVPDQVGQGFEKLGLGKVSLFMAGGVE